MSLQDAPCKWPDINFPPVAFLTSSLQVEQELPPSFLAHLQEKVGIDAKTLK
jgi:hypothetical protein